jgi:hypothetical protein
MGRRSTQTGGISMTDELKIPDDLKALYGALQNIPQRSGTRTLIERIARLESQLAQARKDALKEARRKINQKSSDLIHEHGSYEADTNVWNASGRMADFIEGLDDAEELIGAMIDPPAKETK